MSTINRGLAMQIIGNARPGSQIRGIKNYASSYATLDFNDNNDLIMVRNYDSYVPYFIIFNLLNSVEERPTIEKMASIYSCMESIHITFNIGYQQVLQFPLQLLWGIKTPTIVNNKLYLAIPFDSFFGEIPMNALTNNDIQFSIKNTHELSNYVRNYSLNCKIIVRNCFLTIPNPPQINQPINTIQQISSIQVNHYNQNVFNATDGATEFCIRTNCFNGLTKGFFINCEVDELYELKFYINNVLRINYDLFHIQNYCITLSSNLLYLPFNDSLSFTTRETSEFYNSINFSCITSSILNLKFYNEQSRVSVHNLYFNEYRYYNGMGSLVSQYQPSFINTDTSVHPIVNIIEDIHSINEMNIELYTLDMSGNVIHNNYLTNITGFNHFTGFSNVTGFIGFTNDTGLTGPYNYPSSLTNLNLDMSGNDIIIYRLITDSNRTICNITHDPILESHRYLQCQNCNLNYSENAINTWLQRRRTCPTCRIVWPNDNIVFINLSED